MRVEAGRGSKVTKFLTGCVFLASLGLAAGHLAISTGGVFSVACFSVAAQVCYATASDSSDSHSQLQVSISQDQLPYLAIIL